MQMRLPQNDPSLLDSFQEKEEETLEFCSSNLDKDVKKVPLHHSTPSSPKAINLKDVVEKTKDNLNANKSFHSRGGEDFEDPSDF
jgi:hypothetical protein